MGSRSYNDGYEGNLLNTGGSFVDFQRGQLDREAEERARGGSPAVAILIVAIAIISVIIPYAIIALIPALVIYLLFSKKYKLSYGAIYLATFFSTLAFNLFVLGSLAGLVGLLSLVEGDTIQDLVMPFAVFFFGLVVSVFVAAFVFHQSTKKKIKLWRAFRYAVLIIIPLNVFLQLLPLVVMAVYFLNKFNVPIPSFDEMTRLASEAMRHIN